MRLKLLILLLFVALSFGLFFAYRQRQATVTISNENPLNIPANSSNEASSDTNINTNAHDSCDNGEPLFTTTPSSGDPELCKLTLPLKGYAVTGYSIDYPKSWKVRIAGAEGIFNEGVNSGPNQELFIQLTATGLQLSDAGKAVYGFEQMGPEPLVEMKEMEVSNKVEQYGSNRVLNLVTKLDGNTIQRFFILKSEGDYSTLYMFKFDPDNGEFTSTVKALVSSFKPLK
jgi:hypothetical protein